MRVSATHQTNSQGAEEQGCYMEGDGEFTETDDCSVVNGLLNAGDKMVAYHNSIVADGHISASEAEDLNKKKKMIKDSGNFYNGSNINLSPAQPNTNPEDFDTKPRQEEGMPSHLNLEDFDTKPRRVIS